MPGSTAADAGRRPGARGDRPVRSRAPRSVVLVVLVVGRLGVVEARGVLATRVVVGVLPVAGHLLERALVLLAAGLRLLARLVDVVVEAIDALLELVARLVQVAVGFGGALIHGD